MAEENPEIVKEFQKKVLIEQDYDFLSDFIDDLQGLEKEEIQKADSMKE